MTAPSMLADVIRPGVTRGLDFVVLDELRKRTGITTQNVLRFALSEMLCNALDKNATSIEVIVKNEGVFSILTISDNGSKKLALDDIRLILEFENKASSKRGILRVSRGYLGNALKCVFGYSYALAESEGLTPPPIIISSGPFKYEINLKPNRVSAVIKSEIKTQDRHDTENTEFTVSFPQVTDPSERQRIIDTVTAASMVNPTRSIYYDILGCGDKIGSWQGSSKQNSNFRQETSALWYTQKQFEALFEDYVRATPETPFKDFMALFRGFTGKAVIRENLQELSAPNHDLAANDSLQFLPSTPIKDVPKQAVAKLFSVMRGKSKSISKRSIPAVLSTVGRENFKDLLSRKEWSDLKYVVASGVRKQFAGRYPDQVEYPFLFETAVFKRSDSEGLKIYQCVNFMASMDDLFCRMYNIDYHLGRVGITKDQSVTVVVHFVCPILNWLNYGKSALDDDDVTNFIPSSASDHPNEVLEKVMKELLPIPKTPRVWHSPPPAKPVSWIPHGTINNELYKARLTAFALEIKAIDAQRTRPMKVSSRGWAYAIEGLNKITKDELDACQKAINDCRKLGLLPIDFVKEDQDETRRFTGILQAANPVAYLEQVRESIDNVLVNLSELSTDFWKDEKYYLIMCVEKGDVKDLFQSICREYHVPIVSSKGWASILLRAHIAELSKKAQQRKLTPILLLFYDHDPAGLKISDRFWKNLEDCQGGTGWNPWNGTNRIIIERFGLNAEDIEKYKLTWIDNLRTSSGKEANDPEYIRKFGARKCESNALFKNDQTLQAAETICRNAIEKYYGKDAEERFSQKEKSTKENLSEIYDNPIWQDFSDNLNQLIESFSEKEICKIETEVKRETESEVFIDNKYYGHCPHCHQNFDYTKEDVDRLVRCRNCNLPMRLKWKEEASQ